MSAQEYYASFSDHPEISRKFCDIDQEAHFREKLKTLGRAQTRNFVLDFGNEDAWCAVNLEERDLAVLLKEEVWLPIVVLLACLREMADLV